MANIAELSNEYSGEEHEDFAMHLKFSPYQIDNADSTTAYIRYQSGTGVVYLKKWSVSSTITTIEYAYDTWANRATATYAAIND